MGILNDVLAYKARKDAQATADLDAIPTAIQQFQAGQQQSLDNTLKIMTLRADLAKSGLGIGSNNKLVRDSTLTDPLTELINKGKAADAAKSIGDRGLFNALQATPQQQTQQSIPQPQDFTQAPVSQMQAPEIDSFTGKPTSQGIQQEAINKLAQQGAEDAMKGVGSGESGRVALADESIKNIQDIKKILFPDGTPKSFKRDVAFGSNVPGGTTPILGTVIPDKIPFGEKGQTVHRKMGAALSGRQLIQTGVAARPEETAKLVSQFAPNWASNPQAAFDGLNELEQFYKSYIKEVDPSGTKRSKITGGSDMVTISDGKITKQVTREEAKRLGAL